MTIEQNETTSAQRYLGFLIGFRPTPLMVSALLLGLPALVAGGTVSVTTGTQHQVIQGFGASSYSESVSTAQSTALFKDQSNAALGTQNSGTSIGLSILRLSINESSSFGQEGTDAKNGVAANPNLQVFASSWSPPGADKASGVVNGPGTGGNAGNTNTNFNPTIGAQTNTPSNLPAFATYQANFASTMDKTYGVKLYAISPQNEPDWNATYDSCLWTPQQFDTYIPLLKTALQTAAESGVKIMFPESFADNLTGSNTAMADMAVAPDVGIIGMHLYGAPGGAAAQLPASYYTNDPNVQSWITEESEHAGYGKATWTFDNDTLWYAQQIHDFLADKNGNAYCYWWIQNSAGNTGDDEGLYTSGGALTSTYYMMGNWSMFIRPGYKRVAAAPEVPIGAGGLGATGVEVSSYFGTATEGGATVNRVVIVAINSEASSESQTFSFTDQTVTQVYPWISSTSDNLLAQAAVPVSGGQFTYTLPADSITTFVADCGSSSTPTDSPTSTWTNTFTLTRTDSPSATFTLTRTDSPSATLTLTRTDSPSVTPTLSTTLTATESATRSSTVTFSSSPTASQTASSTVTRTTTLSPTLSASAGPSPSFSASKTVTDTLSPSVTSTKTPLATATASGTETLTVSGTPSFTEMSTGSVTDTKTSMPTGSITATPSVTETLTKTVVPSATTTLTALPSATPSSTEMGTGSVTDTGTATQTGTVTPVESPTQSSTVSVTQDNSPSTTVSAAETPSLSLTPSRSSSVTATPTRSITSTPTGTPSVSVTATVSKLATQVSSVTASPSSQVTASLPTATAKSTATAIVSGPVVIEKVVPVPNPNPVKLEINMLGPVDRVTLSVYSPGMVLVGESATGPLSPGWNTVPVAGLFKRLPKGLYYVLVEAWRGSVHSKVVLTKVYLLK